MTTSTGASDAASRGGIAPDVYADQALQNFYSLEFDQAVANYKKALELDPENALYWTSLADSYLFQLLLAAGRLDSRLYSASNEFLRAQPVEPDPALVMKMWDALKRARTISEKWLRENQNEAGAHFALGMAYAVEADYDFNVARKYLDALHAGTKAKEHHELVRQLDPSNYDANLLVGVYEYTVGSIPASFRWILYLAGYSGSKERGVQLIQDALLHGKRSSPAALTMLAVIYNREKLYAYSRQMLQYLANFFPRNYLFEMEIASSYRREGDLNAAVQVYQSVEQKMSARAPGYQRITAGKLYFQIGSLLDEQRRLPEALAYYQRVVNQSQSEGVLRAQSYLRMGEIYRTLNQQEKAREMFEEASRLPFPEIQRQAAARLRSP